MDNRYTNVTIKKDTYLEITKLSKLYGLTKDELIRHALVNLNKGKKSGLREIQEKYKKRIGNFMATEDVDIDDIDISEAYL